MEFLCEYDIEVKYIQGKENVVADALIHKRNEISVVSLSVDLRSHILCALPLDVWYQEVITEVAIGRSLEGRYAGYSIDSDGLLRHLGCIYVPRIEGL